MKRYAEKRRRKNANKSKEYIAGPPPLVKEAENVDVCGRCSSAEIPFLQPEQEHTTNEEEELYLLRVENLHDQCNEHILVTFFASAPKPANIFLGVDGVILHKFEGNGCAYVLFQGFDNLNLGLLMNKKIMLGLEITVKPCTLYETMLSGCYLRRRSDFRDNNNKVILLRNLPVNLSGLRTPDCRKRHSGELKIEQMFRKRLMSHVKRILNPYHIWIDPNSTLFRASKSSDAFRISDWLLPLTSELAAFFIYMKKNWTPMTVETECSFIQICLASWYSALEPDGDARISEKIMKVPFTIQHVIRRPPSDARDNTAVMFLKNLPRSLTLNDIASIFKARVFIPTWNISTVPLTATCMEATILFDSEDQASYAVNGIRQFTIRGQENWRRQMEKRIAASDSERGTILANQSGYATDEDSPQEISLYRPPDMEALMGRHAWKPAHCFQLPNALPPLPPPPPAPIFAEELHLLCLENLPRSCTIADVIDFFESRHTGPSVSVFLGHDGVIMQSYYSEVFAFVLIKSRIGRECAKLKDNRWIKNKQIRVKNEGVDVFHAMFRKGCFQRRNDDCELGKQVILKNLPKKTLFVDVGIILEPFNVWLDKDEGYKEMIMDIDSPSLECTLVMCEELVAYYVYMKKNRKIFCVGDTMAQIFVQMPLYISPLDNAYNEGTTDSSSELQNIVRFPNPHPRRRATVVTLTNLPLNIQKSDIIEIFKERIMIPACSINLIQVCPWSISAAIFFTYKGEYLPQEAGIIAVDNIRSFSIGERRITVETLCFTER